LRQKKINGHNKFWNSVKVASVDAFHLKSFSKFEEQAR